MCGVDLGQRAKSPGTRWRAGVLDGLAIALLVMGGSPLTDAGTSSSSHDDRRPESKDAHCGGLQELQTGQKRALLVHLYQQNHALICKKCP
jgi:hypothetical protein